MVLCWFWGRYSKLEQCCCVDVEAIEPVNLSALSNKEASFLVYLSTYSIAIEMSLVYSKYWYVV
jgi:hypothetical protein